MPSALGVVPQPGADARGVRRRHPDRLPVHRGQLRPLGRGSRAMSIWVLRGLRDGVVTTRWPAKPDPYADDWRGPARPLDAADVGSHADLTGLCPTDAITTTDGTVRIDQGRCILCSRCVAERPGVF